jgi:hypothetical protein
VVTLDQLLADKAQFIARWPVRQYTVKRGTLVVDWSRQATGTINVQAILEWRVISAEHRQYQGTVRFNFDLALEKGSWFTIVSENSEVISREVGNQAAAEPSMGTADDETSPAAGAAAPMVHPELRTTYQLKPLSGLYVIQVWAFDDKAEAKERLETARSIAQNLLGNVDASTERVVKGSEEFYRVCEELHTNTILCVWCLGATKGPSANK